jgi:anaerobic selenocysteine-containing dehydrogenase
MAETRMHFRTCPLCEATCGLTITTRGDEVVSVRGDDDDVFSRGYLCPKGPALRDLHNDPDRIRTPLVRRKGGRGEGFQPASWDEAFAEIARRLPPLVTEHGRDAVGVYLGNPSVHNLALALYSRVLLRALGSRNVFSASTVDQMPKQIAAGLMFGTALTVPVPDIDRTSYLLILGADPLVSNGSLMTAPDMKRRLRAIQVRGGRVVVIDPRGSRTAQEADRHHFIRPGTDALLLFAIVHTLFAEGLVTLGAVERYVSGLDDVRRLAEPFSPERVADACGIAAGDIRILARELAAAESAAVYGRIGTCTQEFGTLASWLVDVVNVLTGNLDRPGGAMLTRAAAGAANTRGTPGRGKGMLLGRRKSRVRGIPEVLGELPVACLAEEIETPGEGRIRALVTVAGNPVLSTPNGARLDAALASLDFMVSVDIYLNETTRHADVILPSVSPLEQSHYDVALLQLAVRNVANYSAPVLAPPVDRPQDWEMMLRFAGIAFGQGPDADVAALDDLVARQQVESAIGSTGSPLAGRTPDDVMAALAPRRGPDRLLDLLLRSGPYGDGFGTKPDGLTLATLEANPHGVDLGALAPRIPEVLRTPSGMIELAPEPLAADVARLRAKLDASPNGGMVLVGRRQLRSNNSWMHNIAPLVSGKPRCTLLLHPDDAARIGVRDGESVRVRSRVGSVLVPAEVTPDVMPGVVSLPHGWGHDAPGAALRVAAQHAGVNSNLLADEAAIDVPSGNSVLNGISVTVERPT